MWNKFKGSRLAYALLALLCAIFLWLYVDITTEPDAYNTIRNIPVTFLGQDELSERGLMIVDGLDATVTLEVSGIRAVVSQMNRNNIAITVDAASQVDGPGEQQLNYNITFPSSVSGANFRTQSKSPASISVTVVEVKTKDLPVTGVFTGSVAEGYLYDTTDFTFADQQVTISGEATLIDTVARAQVVLDEEALTSSWTGTLPIQLIDAEGNAVESEDITLSVTETEVTFPVRAVKEVPLTVTFAAGGGATEDDISWSLSQNSILVSGTEEALARVDSINLGTVYLSQVITTEKYTFELQMPEGIVNESGIGKVSLSVTVSGLLTKKVETSDIRLVNVPEGVSPRLITESLEVRIRGNRDTMALLTEADVYVEADLSNIEEGAEGTCTVPVTVKVQGMSDIGAIDNYSIVVEISQSDAEG